MGKLAAALLGLAVTAAAADAAEITPVTGEAGSWVMLVDADNVPLYAWYWIADNAVLHFPQVIASGMFMGPTQAVVADRGFMPTRIVGVFTFTSRGFTYGAEVPPTRTEGGEPIRIPVEEVHYGIGFPPAKTEDFRYDISFRWLGEDIRDFPSMPGVLAQTYEADNLTEADNAEVHFVREPSQRVYLPNFGVEIAADVWPVIADIKTGTGMPGSPGLAMVAWLGNTTGPEQRACLEAVQADPAFTTFLGDFGALERRTALLIGSGTTDILLYGMDDYGRLPRAIVERFQQCFVQQETPR